jgi:signal transduction histidine kinase
MARWEFKSSRMMILLTAMAILLPLLAALQYHWLGQVSAGASERLQSALQSSATGFRRDFNRELIRAYLNFHLDSFSPPGDIDQYHVDRLAQWQQTAPQPRLINSVFVIRYDERGDPQPSRVDENGKRLIPTDWTGDLAQLRDRFDRKAAPQSGGRRSVESFAEDVPALIVPFPLGREEQAAGAPPPLPPGFTVVKLDLNYLQQEFIPALVRRHFVENSLTDYNVRISSLNDPSRVIYATGGPREDFSSSDAKTQIFGMEGDELRTFISESDTTSRSGVPAQQGPRRLFNLRYLKHGAAASTSTPDDGRWLFQVQHKSGSLAAAVTSARRRNLAISFGILLLLGAGILMTAISTRRAERLARQQINFVAGVTHELRTPLAVICSAGENLAHGIVDSPRKVAQYGEVIHREGKRLTDMVEQVLEFAGAQSKQPRYDFRLTDVAEVVNAAVASCQPQLEENKFDLELDIESDLPLVRGDKAALHRVVQNLISNAIKYDGQNHWARINVKKGANEVVISVEDRGLGIDQAEVRRIFEPFYRGRKAVAAQIEGSGIGLSLVKQIVDAHRGHISVTSTPGVGSTFMLHLPVNDQNDPRNHTDQQEGSA